MPKNKSHAKKRDVGAGVSLSSQQQLNSQQQQHRQHSKQKSSTKTQQQQQRQHQQQERQQQQTPTANNIETARTDTSINTTTAPTNNDITTSSTAPITTNTANVEDILQQNHPTIIISDNSTDVDFNKYKSFIPDYSDSDDENRQHFLTATSNKFSLNNKDNFNTLNDDDYKNYTDDGDNDDDGNNDNDGNNDDDDRQLHSDNGSDCGFRDFSADLIDLVRVDDVESIQEGLDNLGSKQFAQFSVASDSRGLSPLTLAAELNRLEIMRTMLTALKDLNVQNDIDREDEDNDKDNEICEKTKIKIVSETTSKPKNPIDTPNELGGWTALHCACSNDHPEMVELLLESNADPNTKDRDGMTALHFAADRGSSSIVETLIRYGSSVNELTTLEKYSALYLACQLNHASVVSQLLSAGAREDIVDKDGWTALHAACNRNNLSCVLSLLEYTHRCSEDVDDDDDDDKNEENKCEDDEITSRGNNLIEGTDLISSKLGNEKKIKEKRTWHLVNARANDGVTALYLAAQHGHDDIIAVLIDHNADPNIRENDGFGPLHVACQSGQLTAVSTLLTADTCDVDASALTDTQWRPMHFAAQENHHTIIELLIKHGANVNATSSGQHTPLHIAAERSCVESVRVLLQIGHTDASLADENGWTALHHASQNGCVDVVEEIFKHYHSVGDTKDFIDTQNNCCIVEGPPTTENGTSSTTSKEASISPTKQVKDRQVSTSILMNQKTKDGETSLLIAVINGHVDVVKVFLRYGSTLHKSTKSGETSKSEASIKKSNDPNQFETTELRENSQNNEDTNETFLHEACEAGNIDMVRFLTENGVDINTRDDRGWTPLHFLAENDSIDCLEVILNAFKKDKITPQNSETTDTPEPSPVSKCTEHNDESILDEECSPSPVFTTPFTSMTFHLNAEDQHKNEKPNPSSSLTSQISSYDMKALDLNAQTDEGYTPVLIAAHNKSVNVLKRLLKLGAKADLVNHLGWSALHAASEAGWTEGVQILLASTSVDVNRKTYHGFTALYLATQESQMDTVQHLLTVAFADPNLAENQGFCPLHVAAQKGLVPCLELLLNNGALANKTDSNGWTCLHLAVQDGHLKTIEILIEHGIDVDIQTTEGVTSLMMAVIKENVQVVDLLLQHGARTDLYDATTGQTVLHVASKLASVEIVKKLLAAGADVEAETKFDRFKALHIAMRMPRDEESTAEAIVKALLSEDADTKPAANCGGISPLHLAAQKGWKLVAKLLIEHGALVDLADDAGWTPLMFASRYGQVEMVRLLLAGGAKPDVKLEKGRERVCALLLAVQNGYIDVVEALVMWSCDVNATTEDGTTALYCASQCGDLDMVKMLLFNGADPNIKDRKGFIPLHPACLNGHRRVAESLLKAGSEVDPRAKDGTRPVQLADKNGHEEIVEWLVNEEGAKDPNYEERFGLGSVLGQWGSYLKNVLVKVYKHSVDEYSKLSSDESGLDDTKSKSKNTPRSEKRYATVEKVNFSSAGSKQTKPKRLNSNTNEFARRVYKV